LNSQEQATYDFFLATFFPFLRASDRPIAIACFLLFTFLPLPLFNVPFFRFRIADLTSLEALFDVLRAMTFPLATPFLENRLTARVFRRRFGLIGTSLRRRGKVVERHHGNPN
jgi:hypothetical protein